MTNNEKLEKIKKLADDMYYAAANLGPNVGSGERLRKTMEEYHKFIIHEYNKKEPKFKVGDYIKPVDSCLGSPRTIVEVCDSWYVTNQGTIDFEYEDNWELVEKYNITGNKSRHATGKLKECIDNQTKEGLEQARKQLEEEPVSSIWHDASEEPEIDRTFLLVAPNGNSSLCLWGGKELHSTTLGGGHSALCKNDKWAYIDDLLHKQEEPISEDLEEAMKKMFWETAIPDHPAQAWELGFKIGANWVIRNTPKAQREEYYKVGFKKGKRAAKRQMIKDAVESEVNYYETNGKGALWFITDYIDKLKNTDKVKLIILKDE